MVLKDYFRDISREQVLETLLRRCYPGLSALHSATRQTLLDLLCNIDATDPKTGEDLILLCSPAQDGAAAYTALRFYRTETLLREFQNIFVYNHLSLDNLDWTAVSAYLNFADLLPRDIPWDTLRLSEALGARVFPADTFRPEMLLELWLGIHEEPPARFPIIANCYRPDVSAQRLYNAAGRYHAIRAAWPYLTDQPLPPQEKIPAQRKRSGDGQFLYRHFGNGRILLTDYLGSRKILEIPRALDGLQVLPVFPDGSFSTCHSVEVLVVHTPHTAFGVNVFCNCAIRKILGLRHPQETDRRIDPYYLRLYGTFDMVRDLEDMILPDPPEGEISQLLDAISGDDADGVVSLVESWHHLDF